AEHFRSLSRNYLTIPMALGRRGAHNLRHAGVSKTQAKSRRIVSPSDTSVSELSCDFNVSSPRPRRSLVSGTENSSEIKEKTKMTIETETNGITRKRCRNPRCRMKLPTPVENEHHAFCTRGCFEGFYRNRCRVCEADLRKTGKRGDEQRRYCRPPNRCAAEAQKWPEKYAFSMLPLPHPAQRGNSVRNAHSTGSETAITGDRPSHR